MPMVARQRAGVAVWPARLGGMPAAAARRQHGRRLRRPRPPSTTPRPPKPPSPPPTTTAAFDDFFQYSLTDPITIRKNESALVPILQTKLPIERVTLWSPQQPTALRALWITNSSTLTLDRGSFSIVENGNFGGEGLLDPIHPNERRLLSYAADQAVRVTIANASNTRRATHLNIAKASSPKPPPTSPSAPTTSATPPPIPAPSSSSTPSVRAGPSTPTPNPTETTPTTYRFKLAAGPSETIHLHVGERHTNYEYIRLVDRTQDQLTLLLQNAHASPATLAALQPVFDLHNQVVALDGQIQPARPRSPPSPRTRTACAKT